MVATLVFAICVGVVAFIVIKVANARDEKERIELANSVAGELSEDGRDYALEENAYPEVNEVMTEYHKALADYDEEVLKKYLLGVSQNELDCMAVKSEYIEKYDHISCYTQKAEEEGAYYVYVSYNLKLYDYDEIMPGVNGFYYCIDEDGNPKICEQDDITDDIKVDFYIGYAHQEVQDLYNRVALEYNEVLDSNEELKTFWKGWDELIKRGMAKRVALREATVETSEEPESETSGEEPVETTVLVEPKTTVNVRGSASEQGELKGQVSPGTKLTRVEEMINGWSHVIYNGEDGYIRSDFLDVIGGDDDVTPGTEYVTVKEGVNIRAEASTTATLVGMADPGTKLELIEKMTNGWCKIKYNDQTAYVKSDYVQ